MDDVVDDIVDDDEELPSKEGCDGDEILDVGCCFISHPSFLTHIIHDRSSMACKGSGTTRT